MISRRMARRITPRRHLRHVHDRFDTRLLRCLGELRGGLHEARTDRIHEIAAPDADQRGAYRVEIQEVADDQLCAEGPESIRPLVFTMDECANAAPGLKELHGRGATGGAGGSCDQEKRFAHESLSYLDVG